MSYITELRRRYPHYEEKQIRIEHVFNIEADGKIAFTRVHWFLGTWPFAWFMTDDFPASPVIAQA